MDDNQEEEKRLEKEVIKELAQYYMNINIQVLVIMGVSMISRSWNGSFLGIEEDKSSKE